MFLDFFLLLKQRGLPVSLNEYLNLLGSLEKGVIDHNIDDFYFLCRTSLVKREKHLDRFDQLFGEFFKGMESVGDDFFSQIPEDWLRKNLEKMISQEEMDRIEAMGGLDALMERLKELMREQHERHEGGNKWIGTGGTSPFGAYGYNPEGFRIGQEGSRHRRAVKVWDKRMFKNLDDQVELETRNIKLALRRLRTLTREGHAEELDLDGTIKDTSKNAGLLQLRMVPSRKNNVKVLLFFDNGGSMDDHVETCSQLFSAAKYEFKHMEHYYFHNCIYEALWKDNQRRWKETIPTTDILRTFNRDYKVVIVGDAAMSPYELITPGGSVEHNNKEAGVAWLERIKNQFPSLVWLNPVPKEYWKYTETTRYLEKFFDYKMFPLTLEGITDAIKVLKNPNASVNKETS